jgi:hypothetical protein
MWRAVWTLLVRPSKAGSSAPLGAERDRLAFLLALVTIGCLGLAFTVPRDTRFLMPGPLASVHGAIENCTACHAKSGNDKFSWIHGLDAGDPLADSKACLTCHKMPDTAFNAHGATAEELKQSTERLTKIAAQTSMPLSARAQSIAFPTHDLTAGGLACAACHQEHKGASFDLTKISNEQCHSCHEVKFDSFDGHHPNFENYPFKQRTRIIYDHAGHFSKHFPEVAKKDPARRIPETCSTCHSSRADRRVMAVAPFEQTCTACHINQITGRERVSGPKGIAFVTLPGIDVETLRQKNAAIGEWPEASEAELTPFMKMMIGKDDEGRALIKTVASLDLQDLSQANDEQIKAVSKLAWKIKGVLYALIKGKASDVLADLNIAGGAKLSPNLIADLTASIPRDVVAGAQRQWLPNLATEMANRRDTTSGQNQGRLKKAAAQSKSTQSASTEQRPGSRASEATAARAEGRATGPGGAFAFGRGVGRAAGSGEVLGRGVGRGAGSGKVLGRGVGRAAGSGNVLGRAAERAAGRSRLGGPPLPDAVSAGLQDTDKAARPDGAAAATDASAALKALVAEDKARGAKAGGADEAIDANAAPDGGKTRLAAGRAVIERMPLPSGTSREIESLGKGAEKTAKPEDAAETNAETNTETNDAANAKADTGTQAPSGDEQPGASNAATEEAGATAQPSEQPQPAPAAAQSGAANAKADAGAAAPPAGSPPQGQAGEQTDDLLFPTEAELSGTDAGTGSAEQAATPAAQPAQPAAQPAAQPVAQPAAQPAGNSDATDAQANANTEAPSAAQPRQSQAGEQSDDLLFPTEAELNGTAPETGNTKQSAKPEGAAGAAAKTAARRPTAPPSSRAAAGPPAKAAAVVNIESDVDPESWAEYGGWYHQDYGIYYRPVGHKDKFIYSWLYLTGPVSQKGDTSPAALVFDYLTSKDAQGSCSKCHSVDDLPSKGRVINFSPRSVKNKLGRFTNFVHEPHFGILESRGCLTCHKLEKSRSILEGYKQGNPQKFESNFSAVKKEFCQSCHARGLARQDCLLCHNYHVNRVASPMISTKIPTQ